MDKLPEELEDVLKTVAVKPYTEENMTGLRKLLKVGLITLTLGLGWAVTRKGYDYIKEHRKPH
ncbi:MAG: hypothetical protein H0W85_02790 [Methylotenera sp.]|nr:hypothetical protein [Methylotenera sp.]